jgi:hypothetical protein
MTGGVSSTTLLDAKRLPCFQDQTLSKMCYHPAEVPQRVVSSNHTCCCCLGSAGPCQNSEESMCPHLDDVVFSDRDKVHCSVKKFINEQ